MDLGFGYRNHFAGSQARSFASVKRVALPQHRKGRS
jgi:hypothetical protein